MSVFESEQEKRKFFIPFSKVFTFLLLETINNTIENLGVNFDGFKEELVTNAITLTKKRIQNMEECDIVSLLNRYKENELNLDDENTYISSYSKFITWMKNKIDRIKGLEKMRSALQNEGKNCLFFHDVHDILYRITGVDIFSKLSKKRKLEEEVEDEHSSKKEKNNDFYQRFYTFITKNELFFHCNKLYSVTTREINTIIDEMSSHHFTYEIIGNRLFFRHPIFCPIDLEGAKYLDALLN